MVSKNMLSFRQWSSGKTITNKNKKAKKNVATSYQRGTEVGNVNQQGKTAGGHQEIVANDVHIFPST
jgi:hypothetical protein